ncbi:MAG: hypothetical protein IJQ14_09130, partial [Bacteroidales bacterium]|nr:hypothetical protein [Bacteroidales bacterium]
PCRAAERKASQGGINTFSCLAIIYYADSKSITNITHHFHYCKYTKYSAQMQEKMFGQCSVVGQSLFSRYSVKH